MEGIEGQERLVREWLLLMTSVMSTFWGVIRRTLPTTLLFTGSIASHGYFQNMVFRHPLLFSDCSNNSLTLLNEAYHGLAVEAQSGKCSPAFFSAPPSFFALLLVSPLKYKCRKTL